MPPRVTDWGLALALGVAFASGVASLANGRPAPWPVFAPHAAAGAWLGLLLSGKLRRKEATTRDENLLKKVKKG